MNALTLMATTSNGVEIVDIADYPLASMMNVKDFLSELRYLMDEEVVFTQVLPAGTDGDFEMIESEYGISY